MGLLDKIAVDIWPSEADRLPIFEGLALPTSAEFDVAYAATKDFTSALKKRVKSAGFMRSMMQQRICSSIASGIATARRLLEKRQAVPVEGEDDAAQDLPLGDLPEIVDSERSIFDRLLRP
jgi:hypothetical protein